MGKMTHIQMAVGEKQQMTQDVSCRTDEVRGDKFPSPWSRDERLYAKHKKSTGGGGGGSSAAVVEKTGKTPGKRIEPVREVKFRNRKGIDNWLYSSRSKVEKNSTRNGNGSVVYEKEMKFKKSDKEKDDAVLSSKSGAQVLNKRPKKQKGDNTVVDGKKEKKSKKSKVESAEVKLRIALDTCSKKGDVMGAIALYDSAIREGTMMGQYHYNVVLYLCSSAAVGVVQPAKSGSSSQNNSGQKLDKPNFSNDGSSDIKLPSTKDFNSMGSSLQLSGDSLASLAKDLEGNGGKRELDYQFSNESPAYHAESKMKFFDLEVSSNGYQVETGKSDGRLDTGVGNYVNNVNGNEETGIRVSKGIKRYALTRGFEIFEKMRSDNIPLSEAALTSMARIAMSVDNGDMAFEMVKQMNALGIRPRLRSYGPALFTFCYKGEVEKAFEVEKHMLSSGVHPEEPELEALLNVSVRARKADKVYYLLHKLRASVRQVSPCMANLIEEWFSCRTASRIGKRKWDENFILKAMENGGGGWHGKGWLGSGKWEVSRTCVGDDGVCMHCGEKLVTIDIDPLETENFAKSVAQIAGKRERNSSFQKFQKWLDYYGHFEAVVDAANVGLSTQRRFSLSKVNSVVNGIRQKLPSKKFPLIVVHHRRISGGKMEEPTNKKLLEKWRNADALYATPTGSNDDWYWLYAAIKFKCLIVTNDEMRDHNFQLLGNDFFPKWKERHQVHFSFTEHGPEFHMPPPCSVVIQESVKGHWHVPICVKEQESNRERTWLCVTRGILPFKLQGSSSRANGQLPQLHRTTSMSTDPQCKDDLTSSSSVWTSTRKPQQIMQSIPRKIYRYPGKRVLTSSISTNQTLISKIKEAEKQAGCVMDFQI
ncbi:proteinaceous RNase P 1, chloroplastic/mitochondrial-like isoform X2 [Aristolochia californica]|uniref:proteinaceous RNase P 1, chloroplastic/mitochondrial-like isoform X2 n=1 Tax=Aristolochia californica TaxID=171875 RepID=UPI0035D86339